MQAVAPTAARSQASYVQRGVNTLPQVSRDHFARFTADHDSRRARGLGSFRIEPISRVATRSFTGGDYPLSGSGVYSRCESSQGRGPHPMREPRMWTRALPPLFCKVFFLRPSCSQKRTLRFAEYLDEQLHLALPHRHSAQWPAIGFQRPLTWSSGSAK